MEKTAVNLPPSPAISIIVPTYNVAPYLADCLESILIQTFEDFELIIVDDGSTDTTRLIIEEFAAIDNRIIYYYQKKAGAGIARNAGFSNSRGSYLLFFDGDDLMEPTMLSELHRRAIESNADITVCHSRSFQDGSPDTTLTVYTPGGTDGKTLQSGNGLGIDLFSAYVGWPWDKLFKADFIRHNSLEFQNLSSTNDAYFVFTALALASTIAVVPMPLANHRMREGSIESSGYKSPHNIQIAFRAIEARLRSENVNPEVIRSCQNWALSHLRWAMERYQDNPTGQYEAANDYLDLLHEFIDEPDSFFKYNVDLAAQRFLVESKRTSADIAALIQIINADKTALALSETQNELLRAKAEIEFCKQRINDFERSRSYRIGRAATALPRIVRDRLAKRQGTNSGV
ncbi:MAG: glycosyltransferase family 2 protein [Eggerthellaceae bacterium]|nr:glycosyltransferase family 2 protein [Eggerthellaceae bacterium]